MNLGYRKARQDRTCTTECTFSGSKAHGLMEFVWHPLWKENLKDVGKRGREKTYKQT
jgi:hypothetical protein